jgi:predicted transcriptional regulator
LRTDLLYRLGLILSRGGNNSEYNITHIRETLSTLSSLFSSHSLTKTFVHLCRQRCSTAYIIQMETRLPESTVYRAMKRLREQGIIHEVQKLSPKRRGGPRTRIYALREPAVPRGYNTIQSDISDTIYQTITSQKPSQGAR